MGVDAFAGGTLFVNLFIRVAVTVELITEASADGGRHSGGTTALGPLFVVNGATLSGWIRKKQRADMPASFVFDQGCLFRPKGVFEGHGKIGLA